MQKFNQEHIDSLFDIAEDRTNALERILAPDEHLSVEQIDTIATIYKQRQEALEQLKYLYDSAFNRDYFENNGAWNIRINKILSSDKRQLIKIEKRVCDLSGKLRNLSKQKSVLLYSKEKIL